MTSEAFEVNPMIVEEISAPALEACIVVNANETLAKYDKPYAIFWGEADEFLNPGLLKNLHQARDELRFSKERHI